MNLNEFYKSINGNLQDVLIRVPSEQLLLKLVKMFLNDPSKKQLDDGINQNDPVASFKAIHTLKGVCLNLGFTNLIPDCKELTEELRGGSFTGNWQEHYQEIVKEYDKLINYINELN